MGRGDHSLSPRLEAASCSYRRELKTTAGIVGLDKSLEQWTKTPHTKIHLRLELSFEVPKEGFGYVQPLGLNGEK